MNMTTQMFFREKRYHSTQKQLQQKYAVYKSSFLMDRRKKPLDGGVKKKMMITKMRRNAKALSPIFAILILIAIAVIAGIVVYMFTSGTIATMTGGGTAGQEKVAVQTVDASAAPTIVVWAKSTGGTLVKVDGAVIKDSGGATIEVIALDPALAANQLPAAGTLVGISVTTTQVASGNVYTVTLTSQAGGSFVSASFKP